MECSVSLRIPNAMEHFNNSAEEGTGYFQVNQRGGWRMSSYRAFLHKQMKDRPNLEVVTEAQASRLLFNGGSGCLADGSPMSMCMALSGMQGL